jgi:hypothetical protein
MPKCPSVLALPHIFGIANCENKVNCHLLQMVQVLITLDSYTPISFNQQLADPVMECLYQYLDPPHLTSIEPLVKVLKEEYTQKGFVPPVATADFVNIESRLQHLHLETCFVSNVWGHADGVDDLVSISKFLELNKHQPLVSTIITCTECNTQHNTSTTYNDSNFLYMAVPEFTTTTPKNQDLHVPEYKFTKGLHSAFSTTDGIIQDEDDVIKTMRCDGRCAKDTRHQRVTSLDLSKKKEWELPQYLFIILNRMLDPNKKTNEFLEVFFPMTYEPREKGGVQYDLVHVMKHYGSLSSGHITSDRKDQKTETWYSIDDEHVQEMDDVLPSQCSFSRKHAELLVYSLRVSNSSIDVDTITTSLYAGQNRSLRRTFINLADNDDDDDDDDER